MAQKTTTKSAGRFPTQYSFIHHTPKDLSKEESQTVQSDHITAREALIQHTRGFAVQGPKAEPIYTGDLEVPVFNDMSEYKQWTEQIHQDKLKLEEILKRARQKHLEDKTLKEVFQGSTPGKDLPPKQTQEPKGDQA